jgi:hypothetical protein
MFHVKHRFPFHKHWSGAPWEPNAVVSRETLFSVFTSTGRPCESGMGCFT